MTATNPETKTDDLKEIYGQVCNAHNVIADFRGKLLTLLPIASGAGIFLLLSKDLDSKVMPHLLPVGIFGAAVTIGLFVYELVGIHRCQTLRKKGHAIEEKLLPGSQLGRFTPCPEDYYGFVKVSVASLIVYSAVIGAWTYVACIGMGFQPDDPEASITQALRTQNQLNHSLMTSALRTSALVTMGFIILGTIIRGGQKRRLKESKPALEISEDDSTTNQPETD